MKKARTVIVRAFSFSGFEVADLSGGGPVRWRTCQVQISLSGFQLLNRLLQLLAPR